MLSLIAHNPGITSRQLCSTLDILPPNLVAMINALERREVIARQPHPRDGRAMGLHLTKAGAALMRNAERTAACFGTELREERAHLVRARNAWPSEDMVRT